MAYRLTETLQPVIGLAARITTIASPAAAEHQAFESRRCLTPDAVTKAITAPDDTVTNKPQFTRRSREARLESGTNTPLVDSSVKRVASFFRDS